MMQEVGVLHVAAAEAAVTALSVTAAVSVTVQAAVTIPTLMLQ